MINLLVSLVGAIGGSLFLVSVLRANVTRRRFPWREAFSSLDGFTVALVELGDRLKDYLALVRDSSRTLVKAFLGFLVCFVTSTQFGYRSVGSIFLGLLAACGIAFWILIHPLALVVESVAKLAPPIAEFVRNEVQRSLKLFFWMFVPVLLYSFLPHSAPPGAVFAVLGLVCKLKI